MKNKPLNFHLTTLLVGLFTGPPLPAVAQQAEANLQMAQLEVLLNMDLEELMNVEVVSASKKEQKILEAPSSVTVFSRQELLAMGITTVEELLNFVPGFQATREVVYNQGYRVVSRGQSTPQASYNILFMVDGERLNTDLTGGALALNHFITLANVKQIEVIRGPGSALYGTSAFAGVVNIITLKEEGQEVFASGGNLNSKEFYTNLSHQGQGWKASLFARRFEDAGQSYRMADVLGIPSQTVVSDPRQGNDATFNFSWDERLTVNLRHTKHQIDDFLNVQPIYVDGINSFEGEQNIASLKYQWLNTELRKLTLSGSYSVAKLDQAGGSLVKNRVIQESSRAEERQWLFGIDGSYRLSDSQELLAGLEWRRPTLTNWQFTNIDFVTGEILRNFSEKTDDRNILGLYLQDQYHISQALEATVGVRYDRYSDFGSTTNPRLALVYAATPITKFKLMYGQAFRAPSFQQLWRTSLGNPNLRPETVKTAEVAWTQQYSQLQTTLTYFQSETEDRIDTILGPKSTRVFANISSLDTAGWELETSAKWENFFLRLTYTQLTKTVEHPQNVSEQMFSAIANYQYGPWNFNLNGYYQGAMEQDIAPPGGGTALVNLADYWVWNSALRYRWNQNLTLVGRVQNLGDEEFASPTKIPTFISGVPNRGRTYSLGVEIQF